jgi:hypothetical protein
MQKTAGHILKGEEVKLEGQFHLDVAQSGTTGARPNQSRMVQATPNVRIVQNHPEFAVIEVTCSCGTKTNVTCEYADTQAGQESKSQNGQTGVTNQISDNNQINGEQQNAN